MKIGANIPSLNIYTTYKAALAAQSKAMSRISSGRKVNQASDDPYGDAEDTTFTMQTKGLQMANSNAQDGVNLLQTGESGINGINTMLGRIQTLATEANNGSESTDDKNNIQLEVNTLVKGISNLASSTNINGVNLIASTSGASLSTTIGANGESISIPTYNFTGKSGSALGDLSTINVTTAGGAAAALTTVSAGMSTLDSALSSYGAIENRFTSTISNIGVLNSAAEQGDSDAVDADVAGEMLNYSKSSIIVQAGIAMMAQTNKIPQNTLSILSNIK